MPINPDEIIDVVSTDHWAILAATSMTARRPKWFAATPLPYCPGPSGFWFRDLGALCKEFQRLGLDSLFVVYGKPEQMEEGKPLILCSPEEMASPDWWRQWKVDGVVLNSWGAPRLTPVARAIKSTGARLIVRLDSDGLKSPRVDLRRFLSASYFAARDRGVRFPALHALGKTVVFRALPAVHDLKLCDHLALADVVTVESTLAKRYLEKLVRSVGRAELTAKLHVMPHFAVVERGYDHTLPKKPVILAVGRWDALQKDGPKLIRVLGKVLASRTDYRATVVGGGHKAIERDWSRLPQTVRQRIDLVGYQPHEIVQQYCRESRLMLFTSRYEGFPFAASEALCCGCSVVGAVSLPSMCHIATGGSGTVAISRSDDDFVDAVMVEMEAWDSGWRDPEQMSQRWMGEISLRAAARKLLRLGDVVCDG